MKQIFFTTVFGLLTVGASQSQTAVNTNARAVGLGKSQAASNEETNLRAYIELLRTNLRDSKAEVMGEVMRLNASDAAKFWPVYKEFEAEYAVLGNQIVAAVQKYTENYDALN